MKPEVWTKHTERFTRDRDEETPRAKLIPEPEKPARRLGPPKKRTRPRNAPVAYHLPRCAECKGQSKHKPGCSLTELMKLGKQRA